MGEEIEASVNGDMGLVIISLALYVVMSVLLLSKVGPWDPSQPLLLWAHTP